MLVPRFVLQELQQLADGSNAQKRVRGRRGLDILNRIQEAFSQRIIIYLADYEEITTINTQLVRLVHKIQGILLTSDYNQSKIANLQKMVIPKH